MTARDKVRRLVLALVFVAGAVGFVLVLNTTREVTPEGEFVEEQQGPEGVTESGDDDAIAGAPEPLSPSEREEAAAIVERVYPAAGSEQLSQIQVGIDLANGYDAQLYVNGVLIPEDEVQRRPELNQVFFRPGEGLAVEQFDPGPNRVRAMIFSIADGREVRNEEWTFQVT